MKKVIVAVVALLLVGGGIAGWLYFKGSEKHLQLVPKNAMFVATVDFKSLASKADVNKIKDLNWFKDLQKKSGESVQSDPKAKGLMDVISHPLNSGVNLLSDVYAFAASNGSTGIAGGIIFDIRNAADFEKSVLKVSPDAKINSGSNYKWIEDNGMALAWNKTGGILAGVYDKENTAKLSDFLEATFKRKLDESILANDEFNKFNANRKDISMFMNAGEVYTTVARLDPDPSGGAALSALSPNFKDVYYWNNVDFQNNRVLTTGHVEMSDATAKTINMLGTGGLSDDHLKSITKKDCYLLFSANVDVAKMFATYESVPKMKESLDQIAMLAGMTTKDLETIFGGEISIAITDFKKPELPPADPANTDPMAAMMQQQIANIPMPVITLNFSSKNKDGVKKLLEGKLPINSDGYYHMNVYSYVNINLVPNKFGFTLTNDNETAKTIAGGAALGSLPAVVNDLAKNNPVAGYANLDWNAYPQPLRDLSAQTMGDTKYKAFTAYMSMFKDFQCKGSLKESEISLNLTDGTGNSLYRLFAQGDEAYKVMKP